VSLSALLHEISGVHIQFKIHKGLASKILSTAASTHRIGRARSRAVQKPFRFAAVA